jgi:sugar (pentulose or hexulose) kinase
MTGGALSDVAIPVDEAGMTLLMETRRFTWADEAFELMGIDLLTSARPRVLRVMDTVGHITVRAAAEFGWPKDIPYIIGGGDQTTGLAGNGGNGIVLGSSGVFSANVRSYKPDPTGVFHFLPNGFGKWYYMVCTQNCCTSLDWLAEQPFAKEKSIPELLQIARDAKLPVDNDDLIFLPTEGGAIHPIQIVDPKAQGGFYGETTKNNTLAHKVNAVLEAITADLAIGFKLVCKKAGFRPERLILSGGGAKDGMRDGTGYWPQMIADWTGVPVVINETTKAGSSALGAAMFAGINPEVALWPDLKTAQNILVRLGAQYSPRGDWFEKYAAQTHRYLQIFSVIHLGGDLYGYQKILGNDGY